MAGWSPPPGPGRSPATPSCAAIGTPPRANRSTSAAGPAAGARAERARRGGSGVLSFAGCGAPAHWCEVHHVIHWIFGGQTSLENSALLCERHHTQVHHGFGIQRDPAGRWHTTRPDGTEILTLRRPSDDPELARAG